MTEQRRKFIDRLAQGAAFTEAKTVQLPPLQHAEQIDLGKIYRLRRPQHLGSGVIEVPGEMVASLVLDINRDYRVVGTVKIPVLDVFGVDGEPGDVTWRDINLVPDAMRRDGVVALTVEGNLIPSPRSFSQAVHHAWLVFHQRRVAEADAGTGVTFPPGSERKVTSDE